MRKMIYGLALIVFTLSISYGKANAAEALGFDVSGFVDASYFVDDNADSNTFGLDQVEIDIEKEIKDWASVRLDLQHCPSGSQASCAGSGGRRLYRTGLFNPDSACRKWGYIHFWKI